VQQSNPRGAANRKRDDAGRAELQHRFAAACARVENLGESLVAAGAARRAADASRPAKYTTTVKEEAARALVVFFESEAGRAASATLAALGIDPVRAAASAPASDGPLAGATVVITGTLSAPRQTIANRIKAAGGRVTDAVTSATTFLLAGDSPGGAKHNQALALGIPILSESDLEARLLAAPAPAPAPAPAVTTAPVVTTSPRQGELF
jgi:NAD-dependent DNA ligase